PDDATPRTKPGELITLTWVDSAPFVLPGRSAIVGATSTDFDEVEATMAGELDADDDVGKAVGVAGVADDKPPSQLGRRALIVGGSLAAAAAVVGGVLLFTGEGDADDDDADGDDDPLAGGSSTLGSGADEVRILNWQAYIDPSEDGA